MNYNHPVSSFIGKPTENAIFSIVIPSWNNLEMLKICVNSLLENSTYKHQIIIHINQGNDGSYDWVLENGYTFTHSSENIGVCYAMNAMAELANTDYIVYLNDDMYVCPNWDKYFLEAIQKQGDEYFYFSGTMIEPTSTNNKCVLSPYNFGTTPESFNKTDLLQFVKTAYKEDWFGASWPPSIVHKKIWDKVGGYDVEYSPGFGSDPDFSMKLWNVGVRNFKGIGKSFVYHFQSKSTARVVKNNYRKTFTSKWGITPSYLYKTILKLGESYTETPLVFKKNIKYFFNHLKSIWISIR